MKTETSNDGLPATGFVRLSEFVGKGKPLPICKASYYAWVKRGIVPPPVRIGPRASAIPVEQARKIISDLKAGRLGASE